MSDRREPPPLQVEGVSKTFPGQLALKEADLELRRGQVTALLGENGSGKSTLIKILAGYHRPDPGWQAWADGEPFQLGSPSAARAAGLRFIHQDLGLVGELDVIDNLALGDRYVGRAWLRRKTEAAEASRLLSEYGLEIDPRVPLESLQPAEQTIVAVVRALRDNLDGLVLVLDEPTGSLSAPEVARLFEVIRKVRDRGGSLLYVTHRLQEVFEIADQVVVLRNGERVGAAPTSELTEKDLVQMLVGRSVDSVFPDPPPSGAAVSLSVKGISGEILDDVSFEVREGEVLGIAGITGSGREELPYLLFGVRPWSEGSVEVGKRRFDAMTIADAMKAEMVFAAADRQRDSAIPEMTIRENLTLPRIPSRGPMRWLGIRRERAEVWEWLNRLDIKAGDPERPLSTLSGGNQQRVVLARWLRCEPKIMLLEEPTRGVDIGAKAEIYQLIVEAAKAGATAVIFSSDAEELAAICDRVLVLREGRVVAELATDSLSEQAVVEHSVKQQEDWRGDAHRRVDASH